ncbi:alpha-beta hydrolase superfamily lysophospholipase [Kribbella antiqua]|uniref:Alpha-beta hydrolase superfamily lysophospholipase n=1 Tax=Kribbella antiqua TaxID=2512217 RepID=A0A4R2IVN8_9ACTN|nr:alpha/beta hydrolase [Kribbella antiqua]TCO49277.1 alpha-beta hydrolase superfamily lysophospholipase [Kribbella antiqua]
MATARELGEVEKANASGLPPVVFVHGLWLLAGSWAPWREMFEAAGFATIAPGWPDDPETVAEGRANPRLFAGKSVGAVTSHYAELIGRLKRKPAIVGHSFGGLITQKLAGMGLATVSVPIDPAPGRGVLPLPLSALKASFPVLSNPANRSKAVMLTYGQFRFAFANAVPEGEARKLYDEFPVPAPGLPLFQAAVANLNPGSQTRVNRANPDRGPMKFLSGQRDNTVPWAITNASYKKQRDHESVTEIEELPGRGHSLVFDSGWEQVAETALVFVQDHHG